MKKVVLPFIAFISALTACSPSAENHDENKFIAEAEEKDSAVVVTEDVLIDSSGVIPGTDWEKENLKGLVKGFSIHSETIDENGEVNGMGGSYESKDFNRKGKQIEASTSGCCGANFIYIDYKYNENNQLSHRIIKETDDWIEDLTQLEMTRKEKYFYNKEGLLVKMKVAGIDKVLSTEHRYKFNSEKVLIQEVIEDVENGKTDTIDYSYQDSQRTIKTSGRSNNTRIFYLDEEGLVIKEEFHLSKGSIQQTKYTYEFDEVGNWIKRRSRLRYIFENGEKEEWRNSLIETRTIRYY